MAQPILNISIVDGLDFGVVEAGTQKVLTIDFTNAGRTDDVVVSIASVAPPFYLGPGDTSFTLTAAGGTRTVTATYIPGAVQVDDTTWSVSHDSASQPPASPFTFPVYAECGAPRTGYVLSDIENNAAGTMKVTLFLESDVAAPTIPSGVQVTHIGPLTELIDVEPGIVDVQSMEIELTEDYTTYDEGFWYHVIQSDTSREVSLRFVLSEDGTDTFYFWGKVYRQEIEWPEHYLNTVETTVERTVKLRLVSLIGALKDVTADTVISELLTHENAIADTWTIESILGSIVASGFSQAYATTNVLIRGTDIRLFKADVSTVVAVEDALVYGNSDPDTDIPRGYFNTPATNDNPHHWASRYGSAYDLLMSLCLNFGWVARYFYGQADGTYAGDATDQHRIEFITRGNSYAGLVTPEGGVVKSMLISDTPSKIANVKVSDLQTTMEQVTTGVYDRPTYFSWAANGRESAQTLGPRWVSNPVAGLSMTEPGKFIEFDMDFSPEFILDPFNTTGFLFYRYRSLHYDNGAGGTLPIQLVGFYDYQADAWRDLYDHIQTALVLYYSRRFTEGRKMYERTYSGLKFTESGVASHLNIKPMKRIEINDLISTDPDTYYATEIRKDFENDEVTVLWIQE
jgi:hypothetical protein